MSNSHTVVGPKEPIVWEQFETIEQQEEANTLGIWLFLAQELMFFGGLFTAYAVYRLKFGDAFSLGSDQLSIPFGGLNTTVLLASSFTMAMAVYFTQKSQLRNQLAMLILTFVLGCVFLFIKFTFEWSAKFAHHLVPGIDWNPDMEHLRSVYEATHPALGIVDPGNLQMFFVLYFTMTSMHALHMVIGFGILIWLIIMSAKKTYGENRYLPIEFFGFYWHFVDIVWVFLFPLFYLV